MPHGAAILVACLLALPTAPAADAVTAPAADPFVVQASTADASSADPSIADASIADASSAASVLPDPASVDAPDRSYPDPASVEGPSQQYRDAMAHEADRLSLDPFRPVTVELAGAPAGGATPGEASGTARLAARTAPQAVVRSTGLRREVLGFLPYWELGTANLTLDWSVLSTIAYFGVTAGANGTLVSSDGGWAGWRSGNLTDVIDQAHRHATRVVLSVERFGWTTSQLAASAALLASPSARATLVSRVVTQVVSRGVDGVNLDFEPIPGGQEANFVALVRQLRSALDAKLPGASLTVDTMASADGYDVAGLTADGAADAVFVMGYDFRTASARAAGSIDPLNGPAYDLQDTVTRYLGLTDPSHVILGIPYYGRAWTTTSSAPNAPTVPDGRTVAVDYTDAAALAAQYGRRWDPIEQSPFVVYRRTLCTGCAAAWRELYYDDAQSLGLRYDLANRAGLRGVGMWSLGKDGDDPVLYAALTNKLVRDTTPPQAGIVALPESVDDPSIPVRWVARDDWSGVVRYDVQVSVDGEPWTAWLSGVTATSATWTGMAGHGYAFRVRAVDGRGNVGAWDVDSTWEPVLTLGDGAFATVEDGPLNVRSAPGTTARVLGQLQAGETVAIAGGGVPAADGYTWYRVTAPVAQWAPVDLVHTGVWVAGTGNGRQFLRARQAPNAVTVDAEIGNLAFTALDAPGGVAAALPPGQPVGFSPNSDGRADALRLAYHVRDPLSSLQLRVFRASDPAPLGSVTLPGTATGDQAFDWDGTLDGRPVADGQVLLQLVGQVGAKTYCAPGCDLRAAPIRAAATVVVDTSPPPAAVPVLSSAAFSPNGDGSRDEVALTAAGGAGVAAWTISVVAAGADGQGDAAGGGGTTPDAPPETAAGGAAPVRSWSGTGPDAAATWDGTAADGASVPDGTYRIVVTMLDGFGNAAAADAVVVVDTVPVTGTFAVRAAGTAASTPVVLSPDGDGIADRVSLAWTASKAVGGTLHVLSGTAVRWSVGVPAASGGGATWNGLDRAGRPVPDGRYTVVLSLLDAAGNPFTRRVPLLVDRLVRSPVVSPNRFYPQDRDARAATTRVGFVLTRPGTTTLRVLDPAGHVVRTAWSARRLAAGTWAWVFDGRDDAGGWLPQDDYTVQLVASDAVGRVVVTRPVAVAAFLVRTAVVVEAGRARLVVDAWTSEPLRSRPSIALVLADGTAVPGTAVVAGTGHERATFAGLSTGGTGTLVVTAVDAGGRTNRYARAVAFA